MNYYATITGFYISKDALRVSKGTPIQGQIEGRRKTSLSNVTIDNLLDDNFLVNNRISQSRPIDLIRCIPVNIVVGKRRKDKIRLPAYLDHIDVMQAVIKYNTGSLTVDNGMSSKYTNRVDSTCIPMNEIFTLEEGQPHIIELGSGLYGSSTPDVQAVLLVQYA